MELIRACQLRLDDPVIDVSGAACPLMDALLAAGFTDITVMDRSSAGVSKLLARSADYSDRVKILNENVVGFHAQRRYALWHDVGVFHSLLYPEERQQYLETLEEALQPEGHLVIGTFGPEGPEEYEGQRVCRYSRATLPLALGSHFELAEHSLQVHRTASGELRQYLHCRFRRHAPRVLEHPHS